MAHDESVRVPGSEGPMHWMRGANGKFWPGEHGKSPVAVKLAREFAAQGFAGQSVGINHEAAMDGVGCCGQIDRISRLAFDTKHEVVRNRSGIDQGLAFGGDNKRR